MNKPQGPFRPAVQTRVVRPQRTPQRAADTPPEADDDAATPDNARAKPPQAGAVPGAQHAGKSAAQPSAPAGGLHGAAETAGRGPQAREGTGERALRLLALEAEIRRAKTPRELGYVAVNETRAVLGFRQAFFFRLRRGRMRLVAISSVSAIDPNAPQVLWLERVVADLSRGEGFGAVHAFRAPDDKTADFAFPELLWIPVAAPDGKPCAGLLAARERTFGDAGSHTLAKRIGEALAYAWNALGGHRRLSRVRLRGAGIIVAAAILTAMVAIQVPVTALAPVEVVGRDPAVVAAPLDGAIETVLVAPGAPVSAGDVLARVDDTELRNAAAIANGRVVVAQARLATLTSGAFVDPDARREIAIAEAELALAEAERDLARERLSRVELIAPIAGIAVFSDPQSWAGRPVSVGERIMEIADPAAIEYEILLAVDDLIALGEGTEVRVFLDAAPLNARRMVLSETGYQAQEQPGGTLAYRLVAREDGEGPRPRIGARGTAQVMGENAPLGFVLLRRPLSWLRQTFGL